ncbi:MAG TPA: hypothetical protein VJQ50_10825 [Terriglobales bacterium]|nr:hypothetical protein [Terriglobales bacterium]
MHFALILYGGPDQLMPLTSGLAAAFAFLLIFWNKVMVTLGKIGNFLRGSHPEAELAPPPPEEQSDSAPRR